MFPYLSSNQITEAMKECKTINECISAVLDIKGEFVVSNLIESTHVVSAVQEVGLGKAFLEVKKKLENSIIFE